MGAGIAAVMARAGVQVRAYDVNPEAMAAARAMLPTIESTLDQLDMPAGGEVQSVAFTDSLNATVDNADLVLENVPERLELKQDVLTQVDGRVSADCILASDTSGIPITSLQDAVSNPHRVVGMHWSNPPHIIPMIEVIAGTHTAQETTDWMVAFIESLNLLPVVVNEDVPGFVENRILYAIMREALDLVERGVIAPEALDTCVSWGIGYKLAVVGPMALLDMAGLDIYESVGSYLNAELCNRSDVSPMVTERTSAEKLGLKTGEGLFKYSPEEIAALRAKRAKAFIAVRKALEKGG